MHSKRHDSNDPPLPRGRSCAAARALVLVLGLAAGAACRGDGRVASPEAAVRPSDGSEGPEGKPSHGQPPTGGTSEGSETGAPDFRPLEGWIVQTPSSAMRVAQYRLPGEPDGPSAELVVYHFGGGGGSIQANLDRWREQFADTDGDEVVVARSGPFSLTTLDISGRYVAETSPGSGEHVDVAGSRMLATVVEGEGGPWYVKCVGPAAVVERWRAGYDAFLVGLAR